MFHRVPSNHQLCTRESSRARSEGGRKNNARVTCCWARIVLGASFTFHALI